MNKRRRILLILIACLAAAILGFIIRNAFSGGMVLEYVVLSYNPSDSTIQVRISASNLDPKKNLELYKGGVNYSGMTFEGPSGSDRIMESKNLLLLPTKGSGRMTLTYAAQLGELSKHGHRGAVYEDLLAFDGSQALLLPNSAYSLENSGIKKISVEYHVPPNWTGVVPFPDKKAAGLISSEILNPTWEDLHTIQKCCYAFGEFTEFSPAEAGGGLQIYLDSGYGRSLTEEDRRGFEGLYAYYRELMGEIKLPDLKLVLLRAAGDGEKIIGGADVKTIGATFLPDDKRDWELLAHRLFHAFFESNVRYVSFLDAPKLWLYEGLACYYENMSMGSLPASVTAKTGMEGRDPFLKLFRQYIYMRYKDPYLLTLIPMGEAEYQPMDGLIEFLHYTQAPLTVKALEDASFRKSGQTDAVLGYILKNRDKEEIPILDIFTYALGDELDDFAGRYLLGGETLPLWELGEGRDENEADVVSELQELEYTLWTWFTLDDSEYPLDEIDYESAIPALKQAEKQDIHFADKPAEEQVRKLSPTVYTLLKAYAYRAHICGIEYDDPMLRYKLAQEEKLKLWQAELVRLKTTER